MIIQSSGVRPDDSAIEQFCTVEEALTLGAVAVVAFVRSKTEAQFLYIVADAVREGTRVEMPLIYHIHPRNEDNEVIYYPDDIAWAVRGAVEFGVDVVKVPYCGDIEAHRQIVEDCPMPMAAASGPKTATFRDALQLMTDAISAGVLGGTIGRNIWGNSHITDAVLADKSVIFDKIDVNRVLETYPNVIEINRLFIWGKIGMC